jgi:hypothetical protein
MQIEALFISRTINFVAFFHQQFTFYERDISIGGQIFDAVKPVTSCMIHFLLVMCLPLSRSKLGAELRKS